ncbi:Crp/Fnr family transcriptional regulator [Listeria booriae]|uniref:Crp/Fnr family transcriptional regulator n=1 Tax=Listeria booriae TaxID=1552123 RepID=UPI00162A92FA|nr:Crp/Fnr family transcriptional regulator [Listeria booriae]MBC1231217.1 Crp/Fnr family transcriptional regulator [Listeria booriae]MBC2368264.1 Crp/Fnr family transcriptional regulator [Listeria booriae]MBC2391085.1 Crp/Fnr family transcriptional regulator [Listeria booriae]
MDYLAINKLLIRDKTILQSIINSNDFQDDLLETIVVRKGDKIIQDEIQDIYIIEEGYIAKIFTHNKNMEKNICQAFLSAADVIWSNQFISDSNVSYEPLSRVVLTKIDANIFFNVLASHPFFTDVLIEALNRNEELAELYAKQFQYELQDRILMLFEQLGTQVSQQKFILPKGLDAHYIAAYCGVSRVSANRVLRELKEIKLIEKNSKGILTFRK